MDARRMLDLHRRLAVAVPRLRRGRRSPRGSRVHRPRRGRPVARRRPAGTTCSAAGAWSPGPTARRPRRRPPGSASSAPTPTAPTCGSSPTPTPGRAGYRQLAVEVYGGALLNSWLDRDLGLSGPGGRPRRRRPGGAPPPRRSAALSGCRSSPSTSTGRSPTNGLLLNAQQHLSPVWGLGDVTPGAFAAFVAEPARRRRRRPSSAGTSCSTTSPRARSSVPTTSCISAPRLDNLCSIVGRAGGPARRGGRRRRAPPARSRCSCCSTTRRSAPPPTAARRPRCCPPSPSGSCWASAAAATSTCGRWPARCAARPTWPTPPTRTTPTGTSPAT